MGIIDAVAPQNGFGKCSLAGDYRLGAILKAGRPGSILGNRLSGPNGPTWHGRLAHAASAGRRCHGIHCVWELFAKAIHPPGTVTTGWTELNQAARSGRKGGEPICRKGVIERTRPIAGLGSKPGGAPALVRVYPGRSSPAGFDAATRRDCGPVLNRVRSGLLLSGAAGDETAFLSEKSRPPRSWRSEAPRAPKNGVFARKTQIATPAQHQTATHTNWRSDVLIQERGGGCVPERQVPGDRRGRRRGGGLAGQTQSRLPSGWQRQGQLGDGELAVRRTVAADGDALNKLAFATLRLPWPLRRMGLTARAGRGYNHIARQTAV
jgi:hypothetical protein